MKRKWRCDIESHLAAENARREEEDLVGRENNESNEDEAQEREREIEENASGSPTQERRSQEEAHHAHDRRVLEGDCSICCEDLVSGGDTVWCRAQCRQNFHADCIGLWHASQEADDRGKACPCWYVGLDMRWKGSYY